MNTQSNFKNCSNCNKSYDKSHYISKRSKGSIIIYTEVCEKCRHKNRQCNKTKSEIIKKLPDNVNVCVNCKKIKTPENFKSKTGKRTLKVCLSCRKSGEKKDKKDKKEVTVKEVTVKEEKKTKVKKEKLPELFNNEISISELGTKFTCEDCKKEFISVSLFTKNIQNMCSNCKFKRHYNSN